MRYPGGKGKCYQQIINLMPPHDVYIEAFLGGGAVLRNKAPTAQNIGIDLDEKVISTWKTNLDGLCELVHGDAINYLRSFPFSGKELVYADPPYLPSTRQRQRIYRHDYTEKDHIALLEVLTSLSCMVIISGYDNALYAERLAAWRKVSFSAKTHAGIVTESVWMNYPAPTALHDSSYLGGNFRERQTVKRRNQRLRDKIAQMPPVERTELITWLNNTYPTR